MPVNNGLGPEGSGDDMLRRNSSRASSSSAGCHVVSSTLSVTVGLSVMKWAVLMSVLLSDAEGLAPVGISAVAAASSISSRPSFASVSGLTVEYSVSGVRGTTDEY